jgi:hypothetical protein
MVMRIVLQNISSSMYLGKGWGTWTPSFKEAQDFCSLQAAIEFARHHEMFDAQIIVVVERESGVQFIPYQIQAFVQEANPDTTTPRPWL